MAQDLTLLRLYKWSLLFGIPQKLKRNEQYEKSNSLGDGDSNIL